MRLKAESKCFVRLHFRWPPVAFHWRGRIPQRQSNFAERSKRSVNTLLTYNQTTHLDLINAITSREGGETFAVGSDVIWADRITPSADAAIFDTFLVN